MYKSNLYKLRTNFTMFGQKIWKSSLIDASDYFTTRRSCTIKRRRLTLTKQDFETEAGKNHDLQRSASESTYNVNAAPVLRVYN